MFLFRLPPTVQSMLGEDDTSPIADLAARADALMDAKAAKDSTVAATVEEGTVAAASRKRKQDGSRKKKPAANKNHGDGDPGRTWACAGPTTTGAARPGTASRPAPGRETNRPGAAQRRCRRDAGTVPANG